MKDDEDKINDDDEDNADEMMRTMTMLMLMRTNIREDKPYCANCFGELFAKRWLSFKIIIAIIGIITILNIYIVFNDNHRPQVHEL